MFSKTWGIITLLFAVVGLIPLFGWLNWFIIIFAVIGVIISAMSETKSGLWLNVAAIIIACFRLLIGGGLF